MINKNRATREKTSPIAVYELDSGIDKSVSRVAPFLQYEVREGREASEDGDPSRSHLLQIAIVPSFCDWR